MVFPKHPTQEGKSRTTILVAVVSWVAGCATVEPPSLKPRLLDALQDGKTTREEIVLRFGAPSRSMESERVLFYRLGQNSDGYFVCEKGDEHEPWVNVRCSLVLIVDERGVLQKHSLVNVR